MVSRSVKLLLALAFSVFLTLGSFSSFGQEEHAAPVAGEKKEEFNAGKTIIHHVLDSHEFHFFNIGEHAYAIHLPIIMYSPERGVSVFSSGKFEEGKVAYGGYKLDEETNKIVAVKEDGSVDETVKAYDFSLTKNVVQMLIGAILLIVIMLNVAKKYKTTGATQAPSGFQNAIEPVITFVRDDVAKPNLHGKHDRYLPFLLSVFFFILINNILGLIPGSANVTGNIAFTAVLAVISLIVILFSTNGHFWGHIFWPPGVPFLVKLILIPVELLGVFIKPAALMIRLFANMTAGHIVILSFVSLIFIFGQMSTVAGWGFSPVSLAFSVFIYMIEILVAFIQAFIFTNLTAVFIGQAFEAGHAHDDHDPHHHGEEIFV
ncbi:MAG: F0F1 ATP synthase subunit A [Filimonas sp.]|nr:F0F1 ATP synthase subunit A [Filimonas sp.]